MFGYTFWRALRKDISGTPFSLCCQLFVLQLPHPPHQVGFQLAWKKAGRGANEHSVGAASFLLLTMMVSSLPLDQRERQSSRQEW